MGWVYSFQMEVFGVGLLGTDPLFDFEASTSIKGVSVNTPGHAGYTGLMSKGVMSKFSETGVYKIEGEGSIAESPQLHLAVVQTGCKVVACGVE